jgi:hypothetical protein
MAGARVAFRVRELDGRPLLTLKADPVRAGLAADRLELEAPWSAAALLGMLEELRRRGVRLPEAPRRPAPGSRWPTSAGSACARPRAGRPPARPGTCWSERTREPGRWPS